MASRPRTAAPSSPPPPPPFTLAYVLHPTTFLALAGGALALTIFSILLYILPAIDRAVIFPAQVTRGIYVFRHAGQFALKDTFRGADFYDAWMWETFDDPTHGRVNYVDQRTSKANNLTFASDTKFVMRADDLKTVAPSARGRDSVRIVSRAAYEDSLIVLDVQHMPEGCATWPAFWTLSQKGPWPHGGEIDIIEGVNLQEKNLASLHTTSGCDMPQTRFQTGTTTATTCDAAVNSNQGCGTSFAKRASYGSAFNAAGGGFFVMRRTRADGIAVWFWARDDPAAPLEVRGGGGGGGGTSGDVLDAATANVASVADALGFAPTIAPTALWGLPEAAFPPAKCSADHFDAHMMVFDLTFCGDWAGSVWATAGCGLASCTSYVNDNPKAFAKAYWEINSLRVYTLEK